MPSHDKLAHKRVLVVEDEFLIALDLTETMQALGFEVDGPYPSRRAATGAVRRCLPDVAILDVMTEDGEIFPLADELVAAGVPIIFHSGHLTSADVYDRYPQALAAAKPCPPARLIHLMNGALGTAH